MDKHQKQIIEAIAAWIDTKVIAEAIVSYLQDAGIKPDLAEGQKVWCNFLVMELHEGLTGTCKALYT